MTSEEWWKTPFPHKAIIPAYLIDDAEEWLVEHGYEEWQDWNKQYIFYNKYMFEFRHKDVHTLFALRWVS